MHTWLRATLPLPSSPPSPLPSPPPPFLPLLPSPSPRVSSQTYSLTDEWLDRLSSLNGQGIQQGDTLFLRKKFFILNEDIQEALDGNEVLMDLIYQQVSNSIRAPPISIVPRLHVLLGGRPVIRRPSSNPSSNPESKSLALICADQSVTMADKLAH